MSGAWYDDGRAGRPAAPADGRAGPDHAAARMAALPAGRMPGGAIDAGTADPPTSGAAGRGDRRAGRRPHPPRSPWKGAGGVEAPPTGGLRGDSTRNAAYRRLPLSAQPNPPRFCLGGRASTAGMSRRNPGTMAGPKGQRI